jgi:hypothetical protein
MMPVAHIEKEVEPTGGSCCSLPPPYSNCGQCSDACCRTGTDDEYYVQPVQPLDGQGVKDAAEDALKVAEAAKLKAEEAARVKAVEEANEARDAEEVAEAAKEEEEEEEKENEEEEEEEKAEANEVELKKEKLEEQTERVEEMRKNLAATNFDGKGRFYDWEDVKDNLLSKLLDAYTPGTCKELCNVSGLTTEKSTNPIRFLTCVCRLLLWDPITND